MSEFVLAHREVLINAIEILHAGFCLWVVFGAMLIPFISSELFVIIYVGSVLTMLISQAVFWHCPLVVLQNALRNCGGEQTEIGRGFIAGLLDRLTGYHPPEVAVTIVIWPFSVFVIIVFSLRWWCNRPVPEKEVTS